MSDLTKDQIRDNVAANFRHVRKSFGYSQFGMSEVLNIEEKTLQHIEHGRAVTPLHVYKLARFINVSMDTLFTSQLNAGSNNLH